MSLSQEAAGTLLKNLNVALKLDIMQADESMGPEERELKCILEDCIGILEEFQESHDEDTHEHRILEILKDTTVDSPMPTVAIAKAAGVGTTKKDVNKYLYGLQREGKVIKIAEANGTNPRWYLIY